MSLESQAVSLSCCITVLLGKSYSANFFLNKILSSYFIQRPEVEINRVTIAMK